MVLNQDAATIEPQVGFASRVAGPSVDLAEPVEFNGRMDDRSVEAGRHVTRVQGRLNVFGGLADYSGGLVLSMLLSEQLLVAVQRTSTGRIDVARHRVHENDCPSVLVVSLADMVAARAMPDDSAARRKLLDFADCTTSRCIVGSLWEALSSGALTDLGRGLSYSVSGELDEISEGGRETALAAAVLKGTAAANGRALSDESIIQLLERVETRWLNRPPNPADSDCITVCKPGMLHLFAPIENEWPQPLVVPDGLCLAAIDSGALQADVEDRNARVRTASLMGRTLIDRIMLHEGLNDRRWSGNLAQLSIEDYVDRIRDRLPTKMRGSEFLSRFGETGDPWTRIDPAAVYKVRSRTEHHVYEQSRTREFVALLTVLNNGIQEPLLANAGEIMYSSHWSYGQRCGLGTVETDALVSALRKIGPDGDVFGAKVTARGCGGLLAVLMRPSDRARNAVGAALEAYHTRTGLRARLLGTH